MAWGGRRSGPRPCVPGSGDPARAPSWGGPRWCDQQAVLSARSTRCVNPLCRAPGK